MTLINFGYDSGGGFLANSWSHNKYSLLEEILYTIMPGISFSLFITFFFLDGTSIKSKFVTSMGLSFIYLLFYFIGCFSFGLLNVLTGGIGTLIIKKYLINTLQIKILYLFLIGCTCGVIGLILSYRFSDPSSTSDIGLTILFACLPWQVIIGLILIFFNKTNETDINESEAK